ncbi:MAG: glycine cleavage system protein GcvH [Elusimicrobia bacterium]|nr:glycine cleavage system protein GcvH [Elusimicrobiota bacterium]
MANPDKCLYAKSHEWIFAEGGAAVVGISDHAQHEITDVVFVDLPKAGRKVAQGEACAVVESVKAAFDIYAPAAGEVVEANQALTTDPSLVNQSPHDKGWFFKLKVSDPKQLDALMSHAQYQDFLKAAAK